MENDPVTVENEPEKPKQTLNERSDLRANGKSRLGLPLSVIAKLNSKVNEAAGVYQK